MLEEKDAFEQMGEELGIVDPEPKEEEIVEEEAEDSTEGEPEDDETEEAEDDEEEEEGDDEDEEDEPEEEEDETSKKKPKPKVSIYKKYNNLRSELRETNRRLAGLEAGKPDKEEDEPDDDEALFREKAIRLVKLNGKTEGDEGFENFVLGTIEQLKVLDEISSARQPKLSPAEVKKLKESVESDEQEQLFKSEWEEIEDVLKDDFKDASKEQMRVAKKAMDDLSHAPQFANKELSTVYLKNRAIFSQIFKTKPSHSFESRDTYHERREEKSDLEEKYKGRKPSEIPENDLLNMFDKMEKDARRQDDEDGWNITNPDD